jgi:hypothetical protein
MVYRRRQHTSFSLASHSPVCLRVVAAVKEASRGGRVLETNARREIHYTFTSRYAVQ